MHSRSGVRIDPWGLLNTISRGFGQESGVQPLNPPIQTLLELLLQLIPNALNILYDEALYDFLAILCK